MKTKIIIVSLIGLLFFLNLVCAYDYYPGRNVNMENLWNLTNVSSINAVNMSIGSISASKINATNIYGNGSQLTGIDTIFSAGSNLTLTGRIFSLNTLGLIEWLNGVYQTIGTYITPINIVSYVGNWSLDKPNYYNSTQTDSQISLANTSLKNWVTNQSYLQTESDTKAYNGTLAYNSSLSSYVPYSGSASNVNLGSNNLSAASINITVGNIYLNSNQKICFNTGCTRYIYDNGSTLIITG